VIAIELSEWLLDDTAIDHSHANANVTLVPFFVKTYISRFKPVCTSYKKVFFLCNILCKIMNKYAGCTNERCVLFQPLFL